MNVPSGRDRGGPRVGAEADHPRACECWSCLLVEGGEKCRKKLRCLAYDGHPGRCYGLRRVLRDSLGEAKAYLRELLKEA